MRDRNVKPVVSGRGGQAASALYRCHNSEMLCWQSTNQKRSICIVEFSFIVSLRVTGELCFPVFLCLFHSGE